MRKVFISYRRDDSAFVAEIVRARLAAEFGSDAVFMDVDNVPLGVDFREHISRAVSECEVVLAIIGDNWFGVGSPDSPRRIDDPKDFVRIEIEAALGRSIPVVPVLVGKASIPPIHALPDVLKQLAFRNAAEVRPGPHLKAHLDSLCRGLAQYVSSKGVQEMRTTSIQQPPRRQSRKLFWWLAGAFAALVVCGVYVAILDGVKVSKDVEATRRKDDDTPQVGPSIARPPAQAPSPRSTSTAQPVSNLPIPDMADVKERFDHEYCEVLEGHFTSCEFDTREACAKYVKSHESQISGTFASSTCARKPESAFCFKMSMFGTACTASEAECEFIRKVNARTNQVSDCSRFALRTSR